MTDLLDLTLPDPAANLALDEALLDRAEAADQPSELLRLWESPIPMVVIGRASKVKTEVLVAACKSVDVPIYRRCSGGTAVIAGPGCLMYAVIISYDRHPHLRAVDHAHAFVMQRMCRALRTLDVRVRHQGTCDLTLAGRKFSGNSLRCKRRHLLYHGTVLYDFPLACISQWLTEPPRQPDYRRSRSHALFVTNLEKPVADIRRAISNAWDVRECREWPQAETEALVRTRYSQDSWNLRR